MSKNQFFPGEWKNNIFVTKVKQKCLKMEADKLSTNINIAFYY